MLPVQAVAVPATCRSSSPTCRQGSNQYWSIYHERPNGRRILQQITVDVDDDALRLVFSDWLEEHGEFDRAEFIRVQVQRASLPSWDAAQVGLKIREQELLRNTVKLGSKRCRKFQGCGGKDFVVESSQWCRSPVSMLCEVRSSLSRHRTDRVCPCSMAAAPRVCRGLPQIAELRELTLTGRPFGSESSRLANSPQLATLHVLKALVSMPGPERLAGSPHLKNLRTLCLASNGVGTDGVLSLTNAATMMKLETLDLTGPDTMNRTTTIR